jgi:membrane-associated phospholipid phosphatase
VPALLHDQRRRGLPDAVQRVDERTLTWLSDVDHGPLRPVIHAIALSSDKLASVGLASLWFGIRGTRHDRAAVVRGGVAAASAAVIEAGVVKPLIHRGRPDPQRLPPSQRRAASPSTSAFPSGHAGAVSAYAVATGLGVPRLRPWLAVTTAVVAYARLYTGRHYLSDVAVGSAVGVAVGALVSRLPLGPGPQPTP